MKVGICAIIKDCKPLHLLEWVEWHLSIGVDYFFIYDNESEIPVAQTLCVYGNVLVTERKGTLQQINAYNDCIERQKHKTLPVCDWVAFIDDDEFIVIEDGGSIKSFLNGKTSSGVVLNWCSFGADEGNTHLPQIDRFTRCLPVSHKQNGYVKSIVQPQRVKMYVDPHYARYKQGNAVDIKGNAVVGSMTGTPYRETAWLNHYYCKSVEEYQEKRRRGLAYPFMGLPASEQVYEMKHFNAVNDFATDFCDTAIKLKMKYNKNRIISADAPLPMMRPEKVAIYLRQLVTYVSINLKLKESTMVEIGSFTGESTVMFAERFKRVIAIDPYILYHEKGWEEGGRFGQDRWDRIYQEFLNRTKTYDNITHLKMYSDTACKEIAEPVDFVYIDGEHTYEQCKKDIANFLPLIRKGGYIGGHDYSKAWPGVIQAVNEQFGEPDELFGGDGNWVVKLK